MTQTVTLQLPEPVHRAARQVAEATGQPLDAVLQASIAHALPPLEDVPADQAADLAALALLDDGGLWRAARDMMGAEEQAEINRLLDRRGSGRIAGSESARLDELLDRYGRLTVRKAHAYLLLARRGYRVPVQDVLG